MPTPVGVSMHVAIPSQVTGIETPVQYAPVKADRAVIEVIETPSAPVPASIPAVIPPTDQRDPAAKSEQAAGNGCASRTIHGICVVLGYINLIRLRRHDRNVPLINRHRLLRCANQST